jgi:hypothetical protein
MPVELWKRSGLAAALALIALVGSGCQNRGGGGADDPRGRLSEYVTESFAVKGPEGRAKLLTQLTGDAKTRLAAWSDEQFMEAFVDAKRIFRKLTILEIKEIEAGAKTNVTYELAYLTKSADGHETRFTQRKMSTMVREGGGPWLIAEVRSLKELVEYQNEMSLP